MRTRNNHRLPARPAGVLALCLGLILSSSALWPCRAAQIASAIKPDAEDKAGGSTTQQEFDSIMKPLVASYKATRLPGQSFLDWISSQRSTGVSSSGTTQPSVPTTIEAQTLIPSSVTDAITNSKFMKDMEHLFDVKSGKLVNWDQQSLDALANDLGIQTPKNVTDTQVTSSSKSKLEAQVINGSGAGGTVQPAPLPEPSTLVVFGLVVGALAFRRLREKMGHC